MKYVIESAFENMSIQKIMQLGLDANGRITNWTDSIEDVEELNSDYINEHFGELQDEAYQRGLEDAWEAAQKVVCKTTAGGMSLDTLKEIFGVQSPAAIMQSNTAQQAIDKIKTYEDKRSDRIEVGDIVDRYLNDKFDGRGIYLGGNGDFWDCLFWENALPITLAFPKEQFKKTGKHYDIASILEAMRT